MEATQKKLTEILLDETLDMVAVEKILHDHLASCKIWGELNIGIAEHERLTRLSSSSP